MNQFQFELVIHKTKIPLSGILTSCRYCIYLSKNPHHNFPICKSDHPLVRSHHSTGHCKSHLWLDHKLYFLSAASFTRQFSSSLRGLASRSFFCRASNYKPIEIIKIFEEIDNCIIDFSQQHRQSRFFTIKICHIFTVSWMNETEERISCIDPSYWCHTQLVQLQLHLVSRRWMSWCCAAGWSRSSVPRSLGLGPRIWW